MLLTAAGTLTAFADPRDGVDGIEPNLVPVPRGGHSNQKIDVWTRQGEGAVLYPGQSVDVLFRTKRDAYVVVVNIDTRGRARLLFPTRPHDDGFVRGRRTVAIPGPHARYRLEVTGPAGVERIVAFASKEPLVWRWRQLIDDDGYYHSGVLDEVKRRSGYSWNASATLATEDFQVQLARRGGTKPNLVKAPIRPRVRRVYRSRIWSDETWFEVARRHWRY
jgi:hypothetical protein